jgi:hypothetical protein
MLPCLPSPQVHFVLEGTMEINDHYFRKVASRKELELLRQEVWGSLSAALQATNSDEAVRILARAVGTIVDISESPVVLTTLANALQQDGVVGAAYSATLKRGSA